MLSDLNDAAAALPYVSRALWDMVTPTLRCVWFVTNASDLTVRLVYDKPLGTLEEELASEIEGLLIADFLNFHVNVDAIYSPASERRAYPANCQIVMSRYEPLTD